MAIKTFTAGSVLTASDTNTYLANSGLVYVTSATVGTGVSSVTVSNCFSSTFTSYRLVATGITATDEGSTSLQLTASGTPNTSGYYGALIFSGAGTLQNATDTNNLAFGFIAANGNVAGVSLDVDIHQPFVANKTWVANGAYMRYNYYGTYNGYNSAATSYDGFKLAPQSGTLTGGTITVYGYRKA